MFWSLMRGEHSAKRSEQHQELGSARELFLFIMFELRRGKSWVVPNKFQFLRLFVPPSR